MRATRIVLVVLIGCVFGACSSYKPVPMEEVPFKQRSQSQTIDGLTVTTAVLGPDEAEQIYGRPLSKKGIQPVWLEITNNTELPYALISRSLDPTYYSPSEAAFINRVSSDSQNVAMAKSYRDLSIDWAVDPGQTMSGFILTRFEVGTKVVAVVLFGPKSTKQFVFYVPVPGLTLDHERTDFDALYTDDELVHFDEESEFRAQVESFQCCTRNEGGTKDGDPLNLVLIGTTDAIGGALSRAGWDEAEAVTLSTAMKTAGAFFSGDAYKYSPISPQYVFDRPQDIGLQKARDTIHERNHMRLWLTPWIYKGEQVWIGQISRDIGVRMTTGAWNMTTHAIDPDIDDARNYLLEDMLSVQGISRFGFAEGVGAATEDAPREILLGDPYWTDGQRVVMRFASSPIGMDEVAFYLWSWDVGASEFNDRLREIGADQDVDRPN